MNFRMSDSTTAPSIEIESIVHSESRELLNSTKRRLVTKTCKLLAAHSLIVRKLSQRSLLSPSSLEHSSKASIIIKMLLFLWPSITDFIDERSRSIGGWLCEKLSYRILTELEIDSDC